MPLTTSRGAAAENFFLETIELSRELYNALHRLKERLRGRDWNDPNECLHSTVFIGAWVHSDPVRGGSSTGTPEGS